MLLCDSSFLINLAAHTSSCQVDSGGLYFLIRYEVKSCEVVWCIKHKSISAAFFDESAAQFLLPHVQESSKEPDQKTISRRWKYKTESHKHTGEQIIYKMGSIIAPLSI